jgi:hypothetical protein
MEANATDKPVPREITTLLTDERLILRETQRAVSPFGGMAVFVSFLDKIGFAKAVRKHMPIRWKSPNHIGPTSTFTAFLMSVLAGARRFAHASLLRSDRALQALLGMVRFPTDDTVRNLFRAFGMGEVQRFYEPMAEWLMQRLPQRQPRRLRLGPGIRRSLSVTVNRRVRSKGITRANTDGPATILCWLC